MIHAGFSPSVSHGSFCLFLFPPQNDPKISRTRYKLKVLFLCYRIEDEFIASLSCSTSISIPFRVPPQNRVTVQEVVVEISPDEMVQSMCHQSRMSCLVCWNDKTWGYLCKACNTLNRLLVNVGEVLQCLYCVQLFFFLLSTYLYFLYYFNIQMTLFLSALL